MKIKDQAEFYRKAFEKKEQALENALSALRRIADPVGYLQIEAKKNGMILEGNIAVALSNDPNYLKGIAKAALKDKA